MLPSILRIGLLFFVLFVLPVSSVHAQVTEKEQELGLESCFQYYQYGKVSVDLSADRPSYGRDGKITISGSITNQNTFPLRDVVLLGHLRRMNTDSTFSESGHHLVQEIVLQKDLRFLAGEKKHISFQVPVDGTYPEGSYILQYFVFSGNGFHYAGRPFLEEDIAGSSQFSISGTSQPEIYFDIGKGIQVNDEEHYIRELTTPFIEPTLAFSFSLVDNRKIQTDVPVSISIYEFENAFDTYKMHTQEIVVPKGKKTVDMTFSPPSTGAFHLVASITSPQKSILRYRFAKRGVESRSLRVNDMGITAFPATSTDKAYVCFHSPAPEPAPLTQVALRVLDEKKSLVKEKIVAHTFDGSVKAIHLPLKDLKTPRHFWVQTIVSWESEQGEQKKEYLSEYSCDVFQKSVTTYAMKHDAAKKSLLVSGINGCGETVEHGGLFDSVKIVKDNGVLVREWYHRPLPASLSLSDMSEGVYTAEMYGNNQKKIITFSISSSETQRHIFSPIILSSAWVVLVLVLGTTGVVLLKNKKRS